MILDNNFKAGTDIKTIIPLEDTVFEIDNKSLTNRPDLWGHYGIARELSAGFSFVRVDLYYSCGQIYFGEMTFNPEGGTNIKNLLPETDLLFGKKLQL